MRGFVAEGGVFDEPSNRPLHLTAPGPARACPSRAVLPLTRACRR
jgi:hypothetical protein